MPFVDFVELKTRVSIEQAVPLLGLKLTPSGAQLRGRCPVCKTGGDRTLVVTPAKNLFYCFAQKIGGDQIALAAHVKGSGLSDAAAFLGGASAAKTTVTDSATIPPAHHRKKTGFDAEAYAVRLDPAHPSLAPLGLSEETYRTFRSGFASSGGNRGRLALPLHDRDGNLIGYYGRSIKEESPLLIFPNGIDPHEFIFNTHRVQTGELYLVRDPIDVLKAHEAGVENVVAFLTTITAQQLEQLASLMDQKKVETIELF